MTHLAGSAEIRLREIRAQEESQERAWEELAYELRPPVSAGHIESRRTRAPDAGWSFASAGAAVSPSGPIRPESRHDLVAAQAQLREREPEVEQVAALSALVERADLGAQQLGWREGQHVGCACEPLTFHQEAAPTHAVRRPSPCGDIRAGAGCRVVQ